MDTELQQQLQEELKRVNELIEKRINELKEIIDDAHID